MTTKLHRSSRAKRRQGSNTFKQVSDRNKLLVQANRLAPQGLFNAPTQAVSPAQILAFHQSVGNNTVQRALAKRQTNGQKPGQLAGNGISPAAIMLASQVAGAQSSGLTGNLPLPVRERTGNQELVQRGRAGRFAKAQLFGMAKTTNPFFGWKGYYKSLDDIINGEEAREKYGNVGMRVMNALVETADRIASVFTAFAFIFSILGAALSGFFGTGAALISAGTVFGIIATIAHATTFLLRSIVTGYDAWRMHKATKGSRERALLKAKMYQNITGLISNGIGIIFGGLAGGFIGGTNVIGDSLESGAGELGAAVYGAWAGEAANRGADIATGIGSTSAHGVEKHAPPAQQQAQQGLDEDDGSGSQGADLGEIFAALTEMDGRSSQHQGQLERQATSQSASRESLSLVESQTDELLEKSDEMSEKVTSAEEDTDQVLQQAQQNVKKKKKPKKTEVDDLENSVEKSEAEVDKQEAASDVQATPYSIEDLPEAKPQSFEVTRLPTTQMAPITELEKPQKAFVTSPREKPQTAPTMELQKPQQALLITPGAKAQPIQYEDLAQSGKKDQDDELYLKRDKNIRPKRVSGRVIQRRGGRVKQFVGKLFARLMGIRKRLKKVSAKIKAKLQAVVMKIIGVKKEMPAVKAEQQEAMLELPFAAETNMQTKMTAQQVQQQIKQAKSALARLQSG